MKRYNRRKILLGSMLSVATAVKLILPIPVMAEETYCGQEVHQHTDECREEVHTHDDSCYEDNLNCQEDHEHDDGCYEKELKCPAAEESGQSEYICDKEEHTHSLECYADLTADIETKEDWEKTLPKKAKDTFVETLLDVARSQLKYRESEKNYKVDESGTVKPYSRYGQWIDEPYGEMNLPFVAFVLHYANAEELPVTWTEGWDEFYRTAKEEELVQLEDHIPYEGDLILLEDTYAGGNYVGFVSDLDPFKAIVADVNGEVQEIELKEAKCEILGYIRPLEKPKEEEENSQSIPELNEDMIEVGDYVIQKQTRFETDNYILTAEIDESSLRESEKEGDLSKVTSEELNEKNQEKEYLELVLSNPDEDSETKENLKKKIEEFITQKDKERGEKLKESSVEIDEDIIPIGRPAYEDPQPTSKEKTNSNSKQVESELAKENGEFFQIEIQHNESSLEIDDIKVKISVLPQQPLIQELEGSTSVLPGVESGIDLTLYSPSENQLVATQMTYELDNPIDTPTQSDIQIGQMLAVHSKSTANLMFTVQYLVKYDEQITGGKHQLPVIETKKDDLPVNGKGNESPTSKPITNLSLNKNGNIYTIDTKKIYVDAFKDQSYNYREAPNPTYWDLFRANKNYKLSEIWVYSSVDDAAKDKNSATPKPLYNLNPETARFTNKEETAKDPRYTLIEEDMCIQLRYDQTIDEEGKPSLIAPGTLYDYDITDGKGNTSSGGSKSDWGTAYGINSIENYDPSKLKSGSAQFAFGNDNTGTHLGRISWNDGNEHGNLLNRANQHVVYDDKGNPKYDKNGNLEKKYNSYEGCTFGIADNLMSNEGRPIEERKIQYHPDIAVPKLFNDGEAYGKRSYDAKLAFYRSGDTYTLDSVSGDGISATGLRTFEHPKTGNKVYDHIYTNSFWPIDKLEDSETNDPRTGELNKEGDWTGWKWNSGILTKTEGEIGTKKYPTSDDGIAHNNMFGMYYSIKFVYDKNYTGPMEYTFFGDDDMWVYLDGQKVIDIGGVHSSVGQRVNLRTYFEETDGNIGDGQEHKLEFFYTERGLSGSTCYMQFTLPSVTSIQPEYQTGNLRIEKVTEGVEAEREFTFNLALKGCKDDYSYTIYRKEDKSVVDSDLIAFDGGKIELKSGQYAIIYYLPHGTEYTVTEESQGSYMISTSVDGTTYKSGNSITGKIASGSISQVWFKNAWSSMPATGQRGILLPVVTGLGIATVSATIIIRKRRK